MQRGNGPEGDDDELERAIRESLKHNQQDRRDEEQERRELELALSQSLQSAAEDDRKAKKADEQRRKEERERQRRRNTRDRADGDGDEHIEVVTLSVFALVLLLSDEELLLRTMRDHDVVVDIPPLSAEDESFLVITGRSARAVAAAKAQLMARLAEEQEREKREDERAQEKVPVVIESPQRNQPPAARKTETHIFVDSSNILIGAKVKIDVKAFCRLVEGDRPNIVARFAVGSPVKGYGNLEAIWKGCGYGARGFQSRGKEELHDDALQNMISGLLFRGIKGRGGGQAGKGKTIVLCTGDGNYKGREHGGQDFPSLVKVALSMGFLVEVWTWRAGCSNKFTAFFANDNFSLYFLDDHMAQLVLK